VKYIVTIGFSCFSPLTYCPDKETGLGVFVGKVKNYRVRRFDTADF
jgi:hypothetical protein